MHFSASLEGHWAVAWPQSLTCLCGFSFLRRHSTWTHIFSWNLYSAEIKQWSFMSSLSPMINDCSPSSKNHAIDTLTAYSIVVIRVLITLHQMLILLLVLLYLMMVMPTSLCPLHHQCCRLCQHRCNHQLPCQSWLEQQAGTSSSHPIPFVSSWKWMEQAISSTSSGLFSRKAGYILPARWACIKNAYSISAV